MENMEKDGIGIGSLVAFNQALLQKLMLMLEIF